MKKRGNRKKKRIVFAITNGALLLIMAACLITTAILSNTLVSQKEASRWRGEIVENSRRFEFGRLLKLAKQFGSRSMQTMGVIYPYWENAARSVEDWCALLTLVAVVCAALPIITALVLLIRMLARGKEKLEDDVVPKLVENTQEAIRVRQRRRWEKKHGSHEK